MEITSSPCISVCQIDRATGLCIGCARTGREIGDWVVMTEADRLALMAILPRRFETIGGLAAARAAYRAGLAARGRKGGRRQG